MAAKLGDATRPAALAAFLRLPEQQRQARAAFRTGMDGAAGGAQRTPPAFFSSFFGGGRVPLKEHDQRKDALVFSHGRWASGVHLLVLGSFPHSLLFAPASVFKWVGAQNWIWTAGVGPFHLLDQATLCVTARETCIFEKHLVWPHCGLFSPKSGGSVCGWLQVCEN